MQPVRAKKYLGQHFLIDQNIAAKIVNSFIGEDCKSVLEIGPGTGILSKSLAEKWNNYLACEIDKESVDYLISAGILQEKSIINADFLKFDLSIPDAPIGLIGNLPYNISSQIFFKLYDNRHKIKEAVFMVQKEVADRIASPPGNKRYGILSVLLQAFYDIQYLFTVHEHSYQPAPKVKSAVIRLNRNNINRLDCNEDLYKTIVKATFNQRRKTIKNSLKLIGFSTNISYTLLLKRPEQLGVEEFVELTKFVSKYQS